MESWSSPKPTSAIPEHITSTNAHSCGNPILFYKLFNFVRNEVKSTKQIPLNARMHNIFFALKQSIRVQQSVNRIHIKKASTDLD